MSEFWRDPVMDKIIGIIVETFVDVEGVELVRLNGLTKYLNKFKTISTSEVETIISKLNLSHIIDYKYELICPHCNEKSYIIIPKETTVKLCDTCQLMYQIESGKTMFVNISSK